MMFDFNNVSHNGYKRKRKVIEEVIDESEYVITSEEINKINNDEEMDKFKESEDIGREYFKSWLNDLGANSIEFTSDKYEITDCNFIYKDKSITAEIKVRDEKYRTYKTHFMELNKYINIQNYVYKNNKDGALYVNFFGENWLYIYIVSNINTNTIDKVNLVKSTAEDRGKRNKDIINIPTSLAQIYYRQNKESKWVRIK